MLAFTTSNLKITCLTAFQNQVGLPLSPFSQCFPPTFALALYFVLKYKGKIEGKGKGKGKGKCWGQNMGEMGARAKERAKS